MNPLTRGLSIAVAVVVGSAWLAGHAGSLLPPLVMLLGISAIFDIWRR